MAYSIDIVVPDLGDFENVEIIEVLVGPGDKVAREDGLITLETDKASFDVPAPENGVVESLSVGVGDTVSTGDVIGRMNVEISDTVVITPAMAAPPSGETAVIVDSEGQEPTRSAGKQTLVVPDIGDFSDVDVIEVHISAGDTVAVEDPLVTLETDKAAMDVPAVVAGTIDSVLVKVGDQVSEGASLAIIDAVEAPEDAAPASPPTESAAPTAAPTAATIVEAPKPAPQAMSPQVFSFGGPARQFRFSVPSGGAEPNVYFFGTGSSGWGDMEMVTLTEDLGRYFGTDEGALVMQVFEDSAAEEAGIQVGDVITAVVGKSVDSPSELREELEDYEEGDEVTVTLLRDQREQSVEVELQGSSFELSESFFGEGFPRMLVAPDPPRAPRRNFFRHHGDT